MSNIYLPAHINNSSGIKSRMIENNNATICAINLYNYDILESFISNSLLEKNILLILDHIKTFCNNHIAANYSIYHESKFILLFIDDEIDFDINHLKHYLFNLKIDIAFSFQLIKDQGAVSKILPLMLQSLEYTKHLNPSYGIAYPYDDFITKEYELLLLLKNALQNQKACFAFQPIIDSKDGKISYHECLLRIPNKNDELISAGPAIMAAEKFGMIREVDHAVIDMALKELKSSTNINLSINISNAGMLDDSLLHKILENFSDPALANRLIIEITETLANDHISKATNFVDTIRKMGIKVAIDDFGVGVASLKQLCTIKFDIIKIDGSFIKDLSTNPYNHFIVELVVKFCKESGARTVAEFVENGEIAKILIDLDVDFLQGHFFAPAQNFRNWET